MLISRRVLLAFCGALLGFPKQSRSADIPHVQVGAIRWDAWYGDDDSGVRRNVETTLSPKQYQSRAPFFAQVNSDHSLQINGNKQEIMDKEIDLAHNAGLAFWAYCFYEQSSPLMNAWKLHQNSSKKGLMNWCMIISNSKFLTHILDFELSSVLGMLREKNYQHVLSGRPLIFLLDDFSDPADIGHSLSRFRSAAMQAGVKNPYIALMTGDPKQCLPRFGQIGADAMSAYSLSQPSSTASFAELDQRVHDRWAEMVKIDVPAIPLAMTGLDRRPRIERPVPWEAARQKPGVGLDHYYLEGTPRAIAEEIRSMVDWARQHPELCPSQCAMIYSWDECDEGGSTLIPTLGRGDEIIKAVGSVLHNS